MVAKNVTFSKPRLVNFGFTKEVAPLFSEEFCKRIRTIKITETKT